MFSVFPSVVIWNFLEKNLREGGDPHPKNGKTPRSIKYEHYLSIILKYSFVLTPCTPTFLKTSYFLVYVENCPNIGIFYFVNILRDAFCKKRRKYCVHLGTCSYNPVLIVQLFPPLLTKCIP